MKSLTRDLISEISEKWNLGKRDVEKLENNWLNWEQLVDAYGDKVFDALEICWKQNSKSYPQHKMMVAALSGSLTAPTPGCLAINYAAMYPAPSFDNPLIKSVASDITTALHRVGYFFSDWAEKVRGIEQDSSENREYRRSWRKKHSGWKEDWDPIYQVRELLDRMVDKARHSYPDRFALLGDNPTRKEKYALAYSLGSLDL